MSLATIDYLGGIGENEYTDPNYVTLTGSATIANFESDFKKISVLIDYGMFQGGNADDKNNAQVDKRALSTDFIVLTHAHLDHSGRVPLLVKKGYNNPIYMTKLTALQIMDMLDDYIKVMEENIILATNNYSKISKLGKKYIYFQESQEKLKKNNLSREAKIKIKNTLYKMFGENYNLKIIQEEVEAFQAEYNIYNTEDIEKKYKDIPELLYGREDLKIMMSYVRILEIGEKETLNDFYYIDEYDENVVTKLIKKVYNGHCEKVMVDSSIFAQVRSEIDEYIYQTQNIENENEIITENNKKIENTLEKFIQEIEEALGFINNTIEEEAPELYTKYQKKLDTYEIYSVEDLQNYIDSTLEKLYEIKYSSKILQKSRDLLIPKFKSQEDNNKNIIRALKLQFLDAGHIEGSIQALFTVVTEKVDKIINTQSRKTSLPYFPKKTLEYKNLLYSGDVGRMKDPNISGTPELTPYKLDFLQIETTYAGRNHPNREKTEQDFFNAIKNAKGKVIIPSFSMQRTQEILMLLLEKMLESKGDTHQLESAKKSLAELKGIYKKIGDKHCAEARQVQENIDIIKGDIHRLKQESPWFQEIVLDSPLSQKITDIYIRHCGKKYNLLDPRVQNKIFGREVVKEIIGKEQQALLYTDKNRERKEIIVAASGMCEGGAVQTHLEENLYNHESTILFVGYCPPNSRGGRIKQKEPVILNGTTHKIGCRVIDIQGFSGHLDEEEILMYIEDLVKHNKLSRNATIVLNHGTDKREVLKLKILEEVLKTKRNVSIQVPKLGDNVKIRL